MRFFIDAHLPKGLVSAFAENDHEALHARDLPLGTDTKDEEILEILDVDVIIVSKDVDFYHSALIRGKPDKLVYVKIGNKSRAELISIFKLAIPKLVELLQTNNILQLEEHTIISIL